MKGRIYSDERCHTCGGRMKADYNIGACICPAHPNERATSKFSVHFGRGHSKRFKTWRDAERHLAYIRGQNEYGAYDPRDWVKDAPLSIGKLVGRYLNLKCQQALSASHLNNLESMLHRAVDHWGDTNIKSIGIDQIEDFVFADHRNKRTGEPISSTTRHYLSCSVSEFWRWACKRAKIEYPEWPEVPFQLGWRRIVDMDTQQRIINKVREMAPLRVYIGIKWLAENPSVRPGELIKIKEFQIVTEQRMVLVREMKERDPSSAKILLLENDDIELLRMLPAGMPGMPFFRHDTTHKAVKAGDQYQRNFFNRWWKKACKELGIEGVQLYGGTKHSTVTALGQVLSPEQIKRGGTGHRTNKAFERYMLPDMKERLKVREALKQIRAAITPMTSDNEASRILKLQK